MFFLYFVAIDYVLTAFDVGFQGGSLLHFFEIQFISFSFKVIRGFYV